jgi:hypothetical protein
MYYFADPTDLAGCDPWDKSIEICKADGFKCRLDLTEFLPAALPYEPRSLDVAYAFSVFTHTSRRATKAAFDTLGGVVKPGGLLAVTIRPIEYWNIHQGVSATELDRLRRSHERDGFAFTPHNRAPIDGDITYGDTSMTMEVLERLAQTWRIVAYDRSLDDPFQTIVFLQPR